MNANGHHVGGSRASSLVVRGNTCVIGAGFVAMFGVAMFAGVGGWHRLLWWPLGLVAGLSALAWLCFAVAAHLDRHHQDRYRT